MADVFLGWFPAVSTRLGFLLLLRQVQVLFLPGMPGGEPPHPFRVIVSFLPETLT